MTFSQILFVCLDNHKLDSGYLKPLHFVSLNKMPPVCVEVIQVNALNKKKR